MGKSSAIVRLWYRATPERPVWGVATLFNYVLCLVTFKTRKKLKGSTFYFEVLPNQIVILNVTVMK